MKNALIGAKTSLDLLQRRREIPSDDKYLKRSSKALTIINALLEDATRATSLEAAIHDEELTQCDLVQIAMNQLEGYKQIYPEIAFTFTQRRPTSWILGREERIVQLLDKLVSNAIDYHTEGTSIAVTVDSDGRTASLIVSNMGPPLPDDKDGIFDLFVSTRRRTPDGINQGFGLHIVKVIAEHFGGRVEARDLTTSGGAKFIISFPELPGPS